MDALESLSNSVSGLGIAQFQRSRDELKTQISKILADPKNEEEQSRASSIALYLFPEILPESNFEKDVALELWAPLEQQIEAKPKSPEARMFFEEMKSTLWNYENPKMTDAGLSVNAMRTLNIYHELSSP
jgi:hypothetical protein